MLKFKIHLRQYCWQKYLEAIKNQNKFAMDFWWLEFVRTFEKTKTRSG